MMYIISILQLSLAHPFVPESAITPIAYAMYGAVTATVALQTIAPTTILVAQSLSRALHILLGALQMLCNGDCAYSSASTLVVQSV